MKPKKFSSKLVLSIGLVLGSLAALAGLLLWPSDRNQSLSNQAGPGSALLYADSYAGFTQPTRSAAVPTARASLSPVTPGSTPNERVQTASTPLPVDLPAGDPAPTSASQPASLNSALQPIPPEYARILGGEIAGPLPVSSRPAISPVAPARFNFISAPGPYNPIAPPTISLATFAHFLQASQSPAWPEAATLYAVCLRDFCDPAVALAFFEHESSMGKYGAASTNRSFGNIRCTAGSRCTETAGNGSFKLYSNWTEGLMDWVALLRDSYGAKYNLYSLEQIIPRYAPSADNNDPQGYINTVKRLVDKYRSYRP